MKKYSKYLFVGAVGYVVAVLTLLSCSLLSLPSTFFVVISVVSAEIVVYNVLERLCKWFEFRVASRRVFHVLLWVIFLPVFFFSTYMAMILGSRAGMSLIISLCSASVVLYEVVRIIIGFARREYDRLSNKIYK